MYNTEIYKNRKLNEQTAVISKDYDERLKGYLDNEDFLEVLSDAFKGLEDGDKTTTTELAIDGKEFGILSDDVIYIEVDKKDENAPKFTLYVVNDEYVFDGVNMAVAANLFKQSTKGDIGVVGTGLNYLGSLVGLGDPGDDGTDETMLIGVAAALGAIAAEKRLDPKVYFDALAGKVGNISGMLETEFSGRAEATSLNLFRRPISDSWTRGISLGSILGDIALTVGTLGMGTVANATLKGAAAAAKLGSKASKIAKSTKVGRGVIKVGDKALTGVKGVVSRIPGWKKLAGSTKITHLGQHVKVGSTITLKGSKYPAKILKTSPTKGVFMKSTEGPGKNLPGFWTSTDDFLVQVDPGLANKILNSAGVGSTAAAVALATKKAGDLGDAPSMNVAEIIGWYDSTTADPSDYIAGVEEADIETLATMLVDLKAGTGFFGNTTDTEELQIALIITSLSPEGAKEIDEEYKKLDPGNTVYALLDDELGGDMGDMAKTWWAAITGDGIDNHPEIAKYKEAISKM